VTTAPAELAKELDESLSEVAGALYTVDASPDLVFVRTMADGGNPAAAGMVESLGLTWERYPLAKEAVERLTAALAARDHDLVARLVGPAAVTLPDGTAIGIAPLLGDIRLRVEHLASGVAAMAGAARQALSQLDAFRAGARDVIVRAGAAGAADDVEVTALRAALDGASTAIAADPTKAADLSDVERRLEAARRRVEGLERCRQEVPAALSAARAQLDQIGALVARAADALAQARAKIAPPVGLLEPPDLDARGDQALRPWLDRLQQQADAGGWEPASAGLAAWRKSADACLAEAQRVAGANAAPVGRRNELRGLLDAYRAKAAAHGRDEDGRLARLHAAAKDALYTAPCALDSAEGLVREYVTAVNAVSTGGEG
jgi:hypothetical protein